MKLISKDALVAEMKRRISNLEQLGDRKFIEIHFPEQLRFIKVYEGIINFSNTIEVKEVDLEKFYKDGYKHGRDDMDAPLRIGKVYANNEHMRDFEAVKKLVEEDPNHSDEYKRGKLEAIDLYMGMELFNHDVDKLALRKTAEEQARIVRNRLEQRYREAVEQHRIDRNTYLQITACIEAVYQELFFAGFNVGLGELIGPQKITLNKED